jgi:predicted nucleotidyltransferase component of viral defense system
MLQYTAVDPSTLGLLKQLMKEKCLSDFNLVGGTALALQLAHRISIDLDLFTYKDFNSKQIIAELNQKYQLFDIKEYPGTLNLNIEYPANSGNLIKTDIIKYAYPLLKPLIILDGIRVLSKEDIIPMKLSAIGNRGSKKDFYDIFFLLKEYSLKEMFVLFGQKFPNTNYFHIVKSLTFFDDAEKELNPKTISKVKWEEVKKEIIKQAKTML